MLRTLGALLLLAAVASCRQGGAPSRARDASADARPPAAAGQKAPGRPAALGHVVVTEVEIDAAIWPRELGPAPSVEELRAFALERFAATGVFGVEGGASSPPGRRRISARAHLAYGVDRAPPARGRPTRLEAALTLRLSARDDELDLSENVLAEMDAPRRGGDAEATVARELVRRVLADAVASLGRKEAIRTGEPAKVIAALDERDPELRALAFATVGERGLHEATPRLLELLRAEDPLVRDGAIGALVALREPRAVGPLTELAKFQDHDLLRRIIDAIAAIGGEEARAYLEFVAGGHEHPVIRELAEKALERMDRRAAAPITPSR